jgi:hypothetical protein
MADAMAFEGSTGRRQWLFPGDHYKCCLELYSYHLSIPVMCMVKVDWFA